MIRLNEVSVVMTPEERVLNMENFDELTEEDLNRVLELIDSLKFDVSLLESEKCGACSGSGRYDNNGSPNCGHCRGRGLVPTSEKSVRALSKDLSELNNIDWREARQSSKMISEHMKSIGLGWEDEYYWG